MPVIRIAVLAVLCLAVAPPALAQRPFDPDEGTLSSVLPRIPEPMVFDLVRPLGAERGELEINSLFRAGGTPGGPHVQWAPEIEYTFIEGHGVEVELPMEDGRRDSLKVALQGTLPGPAPSAFVQGWQGIWEGARTEGVGARIDVLYLAGVRWHPRWSVFTMNGVRHERGFAPRQAFLGNYSLFFHASPELTWGLETNLARGGTAGDTSMLMPQVHIRRNRVNVQAGAGMVRDAGRNRFQAAMRVSREF